MKKDTKQPIQEDVHSPIAIQGTDVSEHELAELKSKYKKIFKTTFIDDVFVWHRLNRQDFNRVVSETKDIEDREERISARERAFVHATVIFPREDALKTFIEDEDVLVTSLSEEILYRSGFIPPQTEQV